MLPSSWGLVADSCRLSMAVCGLAADLMRTADCSCSTSALDQTSLCTPDVPQNEGHLLGPAPAGSQRRTPCDCRGGPSAGPSPPLLQLLVLASHHAVSRPAVLVVALASIPEDEAEAEALPDAPI